MKNKEVVKELSRRFMTGTATKKETDRLADLIEKEPVEYQKIFDAEYKELTRDIMVMPEADVNIPEIGTRGMRRRKSFTKHSHIGRYVATIAASLLVGVVTTLMLHPLRTDNTLVITAQAGQRVDYRLPDGSNVTLNAGSSIEFPVVFARGERRVKLSGEAMFDVTADAKNPFIVETFAYNVTALGTRFNVIADEDDGEFSAALMEGRIAVNGLLSNERVVLEPNMAATLYGNRLVTENLKSLDDYRWTEGILSLSNLPFDELREKLEKSFDVRIVMERKTPPVINYGILKIQIADGIGHAMNMLQRASDFTYEYDSSEKTIIIK